MYSVTAHYFCAAKITFRLSSRILSVTSLNIFSDSSFSVGGTMEGTKKFSIMCWAFIVLLAAVPAFAQVDYATAKLKGTVTDPTGAVIAQATVTAANPATGLTKTTKSNADGSYQIPALPPGNYQLT